MNSFLKIDHFPRSWLLIGISTFVCASLLFASANLVVPYTISVVWILFVLGLNILCVKIINSMGLYIDKGEFYYRTLSKKQIYPKDIVAIKVTTSLIHGRDSKPIDMADQFGNKLQSMFFLREFDSEMVQLIDYDKDGYFMDEFKNSIICRCIYDQSVIDYLLTLNPNIIVF